MGNFFKKRDIQPIKKVKVKLACSCYNYTCKCSCEATESNKYDNSVSTYGKNEAELCAQTNLSTNGNPIR